MSIRSRALTILAVALLPSACGYVRLPRAGWRTAFVGRPVALLMEGSAFSSPVRAETAHEVQSELGRPVLVVQALPSASDDDIKALAARVVGERSLRYDWREPQCVWDRTVLAGLTRDVDAFYRVVLEYSERERPATDEEWENFRGLRTWFRRLVERPTVREEVVTGMVTRTALVLKDAVARASLHRRRVTLATDDERIDVASAVADTVGDLGAVPDPDWDGLARHQLKQGCPFLALAIADTQLAPGDQELVQTAAIAAMRGGAERGAAPRARGDAVAARKPASVREANRAPVSAHATPEAPEVDEAPDPSKSAAQASCHALCEMHMVEICNSDKLLWSAHRARWEPTPCGTRRDDPFLMQCYQEQWDTGTFETSCVQPCEASDAGRSRLMAILQEAGCVADPGPS